MIKLSELPQKIYPENSELGFDEVDINYKLEKNIFDSKFSILLEETKLGNKLYKHKNKIVLIDTFNMKLLYYFSYKIKFLKLIDTFVTTELLHWRNRNLFETSKLTSHVFFDYLLPINNSIMTDSLHTDLGERFWFKLIDQAFDKNFYIYDVHLVQTNNSNRGVYRIENKYDFAYLINDDSPWGNYEKNKSRRILISKKMFSNKEKS